MGKKGVITAKIIWYIALMVVISAGIMLFLDKPTITGFIIYGEVQQEKEWNFRNTQEYDYNPDLIQLNSSGATIKQNLVSTSYTVEEKVEIEAVSGILRNPGEEPHDKSSKIKEIDGEQVTLNKANSILDLTFASYLNNGDVVSLYLLSGNGIDLDVRLCDQNTTCEAPGYGQVEFNGEEGWYNITVFGLPAPTTTLAIDPPHQIKIDYVTASTANVITYNTTRMSYVSSAEIKTKDLEIANLKEWDTFTKNQELNGQNVEYQYSLDSGDIWINVPEDGNLSSLDGSNKKIRLKAALISDGNSTPIINSISLSYTLESLICEEDWVTAYTRCMTNDTQMKYYTDLNNCNTSLLLPIDNGSTVSCDYCIPQWAEINSSCQLDNIAVGWFNDTNNCYALTNLPADNLPPANNSYSCDYENTSQVENYSESSSSSSSSSGGGSESNSGESSSGGGHRRSTAEVAEVAPVKKETGSVLETKVEPINSEKKALTKPSSLAKVPCNYVLEVSLPEEISLVDEDAFEGELVNKGNCAIQELKLYLSQNLNESIDLSVAYLTEVKPEEKNNFVLIRKSEKKKGLFSYLTGSAITSFTKTETVQGNLTIEGNENHQPLFKKDLAISVKIITANNKVQLLEKMLSYGLWLTVVMVILSSILLLNRTRTNKRNKK